jgi:transcriptional regulator with XRE-family HTH domain
MRFHIGNVIEKIRSEKGLTQAQLAAAAGIRPNTLGDLENRKKNSKLETLEKVAEALGLSVGELYCEIDVDLSSRLFKRTSANASSCPSENPDHERYQGILESILHGDDDKCVKAVVAILEAIDSKSAPPEKKHGPFAHKIQMEPGDKVRVVRRSR